jgi:serine/threonine protein phosphatase PrpC
MSSEKMSKKEKSKFFYNDNPPEITVESAQLIGGKDKMEDYLVNIRFTVPDQGVAHFCAVMDGHGGDTVARGLATALIAIVPGTVLMKNLDQIASERTGETLCSIIKKAREVTERQTPIAVFSRSGTTIVCVLAIACASVPPGEWHLSWASIGDSSIVFIPRDGVRAPYKITTDHNSSHPLEKERCTNMGGAFTKEGYLVKKEGTPDYGLSMTRSIGDKVLNEVGLIDTPDSGMLYMMKDDRIVLVSDGVTDAFQKDQSNAVSVLVSWLNPHVYATPAKNAVVNATGLFGTNADNATCIIMNF